MTLSDITEDVEQERVQLLCSAAVALPLYLTELRKVGA